MKRYFQTEYKGQNQLYLAIAEKINEYYPIGINRDTPEYKEYPGIKKIMSVLEKNMTDYNNQNKPWKSFLKQLRKGSKKKIHDTTIPHELAFQAELILKKYQDESLIYIKKIVFTVSFIGPFFSVYGIDITFIKENADGSGPLYDAVNVVTESPYKEFESAFNYLKEEIAEQFGSYKFVPIRVGLYDVKGLQTPYSDRDECTVYNALFDAALDYQPFQFFRGEMYYGSEKNPNIKVVLGPPPPYNPPKIS
jgi:hypothetical protein